MRQYFMDTEFNQDKTYVELLSIGIVSDDGREYYAQNQNADLTKSGEYVRENVLPLMDETSWRPIQQIREEVTNFILPNGREDLDPWIWAWYGNYDWVAFCGTIYGNMVAVPDGMPWNVMDLKQWADMLGITTRPESPIGEHNALVDARWNRDYYYFLQDEDERLHMEALNDYCGSSAYQQARKHEIRTKNNY